MGIVLMKGFVMKSRLLLLIAVTIFLFAATGLKAELPQTNEQFVSNSITETVSAFFDSLGLFPAQVEFEPSDGLNAIAVDGVKAVLIGKGWSLNSGLSENSSNVYKIGSVFSAFEFKYKRGGSRGFLKKPYIKRVVSGQLLLSISSIDFNHVGFLDFSDTDQVLPERENYIASVRYKQLAPPVSMGGVERYLEPLAVTATVAALTYLFFINR